MTVATEPLTSWHGTYPDYQFCAPTEMPFSAISWRECVELLGVTVIDGELAALGLYELTEVAPYLPPATEDGRWLLDTHLPHRRVPVAGYIVPLYA